MKKAIIILTIVALIAPMALFAQGSKEASGPITIKFWTHEDVNRNPLELQYIAEFEAANPNVKVEYTTQASGKMADIVQTAFAANQGPTIFNLPISDEYAYIVNGRVAPVDAKAAGYADYQAIKSAYVDGTLDSVTVDGKIYGLPLELTNWAILLNKGIFRDAGLDPDKDYPKTWEDMVAVSEKIIQRDGDIITRRGFDFRYGYYLEWLVPMVEQLGGKLISDDGKTAIVGDDAWLKVLTFMQQWGPNGKNLGSSTYTAARKLFNKNNGDIAMALTGYYQTARISEENPEFYASGDLMVIPFPQFKDAVKEVANCYYGHFYMVNAQASKAEQEAAWKLIGYLLSHGDEYLDKAALPQPTKKLFESPEYKAKPYTDVFSADMEKAHIMYYSENSAEMQKLLKSAVESVMLSGVSPEKALATLKASAQELIDEN